MQPESGDGSDSEEEEIMEGENAGDKVNDGGKWQARTPETTISRRGRQQRREATISRRGRRRDDNNQPMMKVMKTGDGKNKKEKIESRH